jgi:photosystem II stability/assembly factor-like uncharacterized protein
MDAYVLGMRLWATTGRAVARIDEDAGRRWSVSLSLADSGAHCISPDPADPDTAYAGLREDGLRKTTDGGRTWRDVELPERGVFSVGVSPADGAVYAGCEPSRLFRSEDGGESWSALDALLELPSRPTWSFPPRPWTSHVRWIAPSPSDAALLLVGIELGGLMRSADRGESWVDHRPGAQRDVHSVVWHQREPGRAYEAGGGGAAFSVDGGESWTPADEGRDRHYTWAVATDPADPERWWVTASSGPFAAHGGRNADARIFRRVGDAPWETVTDVLATMPYALTAVDGRLFAGFADGRVLETSDGAESWHELSLEGDAPVGLNALAWSGA